MTIAAISSLFLVVMAIILWQTRQRALKREQMAFLRGVEHGKALEWEANYFAKIEADKKRRGPDGKFRKQTT